jgi:exopolysaccharide biosynthesis protein
MHVHPGVQLRRVRVEIGDLIERVTIVRVEPGAAYFRVHYDPLAPRPVSAWANRLDPILVINGSYFSEENVSIGLLISDGQVWGPPYGSFAGQFAVTADEQVRVSWLRERPYDRDEPLKEALQSFPVLVKPGGVMGFPADADDGRPSRRSVVAQDVEGRILFIVAPNGYFSLHTLARFLAESDLGIDVALNLDGGTSAGLWVLGDPAPLVIDSLVSVPSIISVYPR